MKKLTALLALATALCIVFSCLPFAVPADAADVEKYPLWVGGVQVTSQNRYNIPGVKTGAATYDPETATLTLEDVTGMRGAYLMGSYMVGVYAKGLDLTVEGVQADSGIWEKDNLVDSTGYGIYCEKCSLTLRGTLKFSGPSGGIYTEGSLTVEEGAQITAETSGASSSAVRMREGGTFAGGLTATGGYHAFEADGPMTVTGGRITATGARYGLYNGNYYMNHAKYVQTGGEVYAEATDADGVGFAGYYSVSITGGVLHGKGKGGAVKSDHNTVSLGENMRVVLPANGKLSTNKTEIVDAADHTATEAELREYVEYPLYIGSTAVTSLNRDDLGELLAELNDYNMNAYTAGELSMAFDGDKTLTLSGSIRSNTTLITSELPGLIVEAAPGTSVTLAGSADFLDIREDAVLTGGPMTVSGADSAVFVTRARTLSLERLDMTVQGSRWAFGGPNYQDYAAALNIDQCMLTLNCTNAAIADFRGGVTVNNCRVVSPAKYVISESGALCEAGGGVSKNVQIDHLYEFTRQPVGGVVEPGCYRMVTWETNFTAIRTEWLSNGSVYMYGGGDYQSDIFDATDKTLQVRQYYASGKYVTSDPFYITQTAEDEVVEYPLLVGGVRVTSKNRQDLGAVFASLNETNRALYEAGELTASFDGSFRLRLSGKIKTGAAVVENQGLEGFEIYTSGDTSLLSTGASAIVTATDTQIYGPGKLTVISDADCGIFVNKDACLTVGRLRLEATGKYAGIAGNGSKKSKERLEIYRSVVVASGNAAISRFNGGITLNGCAVAEPENAVVGMSEIYRPDHTAADRVVIDRDRYDLWVGGVRVTRDNLDDIPGVTGGKASYDPFTATLDLENVTGAVGGYLYTSGYGGAQIYCNEYALAITGKAAFEGESECYLIFTGGRLAVTADLTLRAAEGGAIRVGNGLTVKDCTLDLESENGYCISAVNSGMKVQNATVTAVGSTGISVRDSLEIEDSVVTAKSTSGYGIYSGTTHNTCLSVKNSTVRVEASGSNNPFVSNYGVVRLLEGADVESAYTGTATNRTGIFSSEPMEIDGSLEIVLPEGGKLSENQRNIVTAEGVLAPHVHVKPKHVHTPVAVAGEPATCETDGILAHFRCTGCGALFRDEACTLLISAKELKIDKTGHSPVFVPEVPAEIGRDGVKSHYRCEKCGKLFQDEACTTPATEEYLRIPMLTGPDYKLGDVDEDGEITSADARLALRRAVDLETYAKGSREFLACDVDKDGEVTSADARKILRAAVELEDPATW